MGEVLGLVYSSEPGDVRFDPSKKLLTCPWHGWEFDIKTGQSYFNPRLRARRYDVEVQQESAMEENFEGAEEGDVSRGLMRRRSCRYLGKTATSWLRCARGVARPPLKLEGRHREFRELVEKRP